MNLTCICFTFRYRSQTTDAHKKFTTQSFPSKPHVDTKQKYKSIDGSGILKNTFKTENNLGVLVKGNLEGLGSKSKKKLPDLIPISECGALGIPLNKNKPSQLPETDSSSYTTENNCESQDMSGFSGKTFRFK